MRIRTVAAIGILFLTAWVGLAQSAMEGDPNHAPAPRSVEPMAPDAYGGGPQYVVLGAAAFHPQGNGTYSYAYPGYIYRTGGTTVFWAPVNLPNGARVEQVCVALYDTNVGEDIGVNFGVYELGSSTANPPANVPISGSNNDAASGYHQFCLSSNHTFRTVSDFNGDGGYNYGAYRIEVHLPAADNTMRLGGAMIRYRLQVTPAPLVATFPNDVPTSHPFFRFVEALAAAGITAGCGVDSYCPDQPVTRGQMAVFLAAALGLHWPL